MQRSYYYKVLGLADSASEAEVRRAFRKLVMRYHPDKNPSPEANAMFLKITEAYEVLTGKRALPTEPTRSRTKATPTQHEKEVRVKEAQKRYQEQAYRHFLDNELYYRKLTSGMRWKIIKMASIFGLLLALLMIADGFLPRHYEHDRVTHYNLNVANGTDGRSISLIKTERNDLYWINDISYGLYLVDSDILIETSWFFHNPIRIVSTIDLKPRYYRIDFNHYRHAWLFVLIFLVPLVTRWYKRKNLVFSFLCQLSYLATAMMVYYTITGARWAHLLSLGFL